MNCSGNSATNLHNASGWGRIYRHDMRHHLRILDSLAQQDNAADILAYIGQLNGRLSDISERSYCANPSVNAVLASFLGQAEKAGCAVTSSICLPRQFPFDELDICVLLANPLENALRACQPKSVICGYRLS